MAGAGSSGVGWPRAAASLDGLSLGDAFGEQFFVPTDQAEQAIRARQAPGDSTTPWRFTDDTLMTVLVAGSLARFGEINQDWLAVDFAARYQMDWGYGPTMHGCLALLRKGGDWRGKAPALWLAVSVLRDQETICAIVGGIAMLSAEAAAVPDAWRKRREPLPDWHGNPAFT